MGGVHSGRCCGRDGARCEVSSPGPSFELSNSAVEVYQFSISAAYDIY